MIANEVIYDIFLDAIKENVNLSNAKKYEVIPNRLFRFEKFEDVRLDTLEKNMIYMSDAENFNDPFDCLGVWWDTLCLKIFQTNRA